MQNTNLKKLLRVLALILILALTLGCFAACGNDNNSDDEDEDEDKRSSTGTGKLIQHSWKGLNFELPDNYEDMSNEGYAFYRAETVSLCVSDETTPANITDSQSYANYFKNTNGTNYKTISVSSKNGVYYTVGDYADGTTEVRAFYVNGNHCWVMYTSCYTENYSDDQISLVTCGTIDKSYQYTPDDSGSEYPGPTQKPSTPPAEQPTVPDPKPPVEQPTKPQLKQYSFEGLTYKIGEDYNATNTGDSITHSNGSTAILVVSGWTPDNVTDSNSFAQYFANEAASAGYSSQKMSSNGVAYTVTDWNDGTIEVRGFYVYNGYGWSIYATTMKYASESDLLIQYVTSGVIDKNYDHSTNPTPTPTPTPTPDEGTINVYTLVPSSWGTPGCWAWNNVTKTDAFDAWPGATMMWTGKYYTTTAPDWVDSVIVNGNGGTIQTEDIAINSGYDVWVIIHADGEWYSLLYAEPTADELAQMGY